jgi:hypothetical protein
MSLCGCMLNTSVEGSLDSNDMRGVVGCGEQKPHGVFALHVCNIYEYSHAHRTWRHVQLCDHVGAYSSRS